MRNALIVIGLLIAAVGVAGFAGLIEYSQMKDVVEIGEFSASVERKERPPLWVNATLLGAGALLAGFGLAKRR
ncbi:MAG TPA: hypothetical protein PKZ76_08350 [Xanthomonadaceae bacterium]|nr:hypothetical protein [Xanthomonadaceae bacterium]